MKLYWRYCIYYSRLENFIYFTIIIELANWWTYFCSLVSISGPLPTWRPFYVMVFPISVCSVGRTVYQPTIQTLFESIDPKTLCQYSMLWKRFCNWINVSENACHFPWYVTFSWILCLKSFKFNTFSIELYPFSSPNNDFANDIFFSRLFGFFLWKEASNHQVYSLLASWKSFAFSEILATRNQLTLRQLTIKNLFLIAITTSDIG